MIATWSLKPTRACIPLFRLLNPWSIIDACFPRELSWRFPIVFVSCNSASVDLAIVVDIAWADFILAPYAALDTTKSPLVTSGTPCTLLSSSDEVVMVSPFASASISSESSISPSRDANISPISI